MGDIIPYCMPDFGKCGAAFGELAPAFSEAIEWVTSQKWLSCEETGTKDFVQNPSCVCWYNLPLCLGNCLIPCCVCATGARNLEKMNGKSYEANCVSACLLNCCCYFGVCWYAKQRSEFRKKYDIKGSDGMDCLNACCFGPCAICQDANQLMKETDYKVPMAQLS